MLVGDGLFDDEHLRKLTAEIGRKVRKCLDRDMPSSGRSVDEVGDELALMSSDIDAVGVLEKGSIQQLRDRQIVSCLASTHPSVSESAGGLAEERHWSNPMPAAIIGGMA